MKMMKLWVFALVFAPGMAAESFFVLTGLKSDAPVASIGAPKVDMYV